MFHIKNYYSEEDVLKGYITTIGRDGKKTDFPLISISLGCVKLTGKHFKNYIDVSDACTEAKKMAKNSSGSSIRTS